MAKDYYKILGVDKKASDDEIKKAFRTMAHKHHPDKATGDGEKFREANEAYQVLSDKEKRAAYDNYGADYHQQGPAGGGPGPGAGGFGGGFGAAGFDFSDLGDIFSAFGGQQGGRQERDLNQAFVMHVSFSDSYHGAKREITLRQSRRCARCEGSGAEPGTKAPKCKKCEGRGQVRGYQQTFFGRMETVMQCGACHGAGTVPEKACRECDGHGIEEKNRTLEVAIPAGIREGQQLRLRGEGEQNRNGEAGDVYLEIRVEADPHYRRDGDDVRTNAKIDWRMAALGGSVPLQWLGKKIDLEIPSGSQPGDQLRLKGLGFPHGGSRGNGIVTLSVELPKKLTKKQREILEKWEG